MTHGMALTNKFMLGAATVMIGAQADLFNLTRATHSVGLVKNFRLQTNPTFVDLTQGVKNTTVYSVMNGNTATGSAELYEYSPKNLAYLASVNGAAVTPVVGFQTTLTGAVTGSTGTPATTFNVASATGLAANDWVIIEDPAFPDDAIVRQIASIATLAVTPTQNIQRNLSNGSIVKKLNITPIASKQDQPFFSAMVIGRLADNTDVALALPKIRITGGLNVAFQTNDYGNMPLEFTVFDLVPSDPNYATFGSTPAQLFTEG